MSQKEIFLFIVLGIIISAPALYLMSQENGLALAGGFVMIALLLMPVVGTQIDRMHRHRVTH